MLYDEIVAKILVGNAVKHLRNLIKPLAPEDRIRVFIQTCKGYCPLCGKEADDCQCGRCESSLLSKR